jgi:hypothetical protein
MLKHQFSWVERDLNLEKICKSIPIPNKKTLKKKAVVVKTKVKKVKKLKIYIHCV